MPPVPRRFMHSAKDMLHTSRRSSSSGVCKCRHALFPGACQAYDNHTYAKTTSQGWHGISQVSNEANFTSHQDIYGRTMHVPIYRLTMLFTGRASYLLISNFFCLRSSNSNLTFFITKIPTDLPDIITQS
jgi:hypothetical protein